MKDFGFRNIINFLENKNAVAMSNTKLIFNNYYRICYLRKDLKICLQYEYFLCENTYIFLSTNILINLT